MECSQVYIVDDDEEEEILPSSGLGIKRLPHGCGRAFIPVCVNGAHPEEFRVGLTET